MKEVKNEISIFENPEFGQVRVLDIDGIECFEKDGIAYLKLETVAMGLGFTQIKNGATYIRWETVHKYLEEIGFPSKLGKGEFIPENIFYRLAMKAKNEAAEKFQAKIADEVIPSIRKHGAYMTPATIEQAILNPDFIIQLATALKDEQTKRKELEVKNQDLQEFNKALTTSNTEMKPKADYYDEMVDCGGITGIRETAKLIGIKERLFVAFC